MKEMTGSGIFVGDGENGASEAGSAKRVYQVFIIIMTPVNVMLPTLYCIWVNAPH